MRVDASKSEYHEHPDARNDFSRKELKYARLLLRRLRYLEAQIRENGGLADGNASGGAAFVEWEVEALEWVLGTHGVNFLDEKRVPA